MKDEVSKYIGKLLDDITQELAENMRNGRAVKKPEEYYKQILKDLSVMGYKLSKEQKLSLKKEIEMCYLIASPRPL